MYACTGGYYILIYRINGCLSLEETIYIYKPKYSVRGISGI